MHKVIWILYTPPPSTLEYNQLWTYELCWWLQTLDTLDNGKPFKDALGDAGTAVKLFRYYGGMADKIVGQTVPAGTNVWL